MSITPLRVGTPTPFISDLSHVTDGHEVGTQTSLDKTGYATLVTGGVPDLSVPNPSIEDQSSVLDNYSNNSIVQTLRNNEGTAPSTVQDVDGRVIVPTTNGYINLGSGHQLEFDDQTLAGRITPAMNPQNSLQENRISYTGSDIRLIIEIPDPNKQGDSAQRYAKKLFECTTITVSVHRAKSQVRALGYINPKGFARGTRTVAGTIILTQFTVDALYNFLQSGQYTNDKSKDSTYLKVDQLPPFNITILFCNEQGFASYRRLLGVEFVTDGTTYSIQDMYTEQSITFMCEDFTPLLPLDLSSLFNSTIPKDPTTSPEATPKDKMFRYANINPNKTLGTGTNA
jgi:hypothetical protein